MHPWLATYIWMCATMRLPTAQLAGQCTEADVPGGNVGGGRLNTKQNGTKIDASLPLAVAMRLTHLRDPAHSLLPLSRFYSERYRNY